MPTARRAPGAIAAPDGLSTLIGQRPGSYEITTKLGEVGMGEVYRAHDTKLERDVAIKVLPREFTEDKECLARFEREAQLLAQLHHPNIASIFTLEKWGQAPISPPVAPVECEASNEAVAA